MHHMEPTQHMVCFSLYAASRATTKAYAALLEPHGLTYPQYRAVRRLVHDCCNYDGGNCLLLDDGEECVCPQSISYSLICRWFRAAVLPLDESLCAALLHRRERKKCVLCGGWYIPKSNRAKYCPECAKEEERRKTRERVRRHRAAM